jgi:hypothetical protein
MTDSTHTDSDATVTQFAEQVRDCMREQGLNQARLVELTGLKQPALSLLLYEKNDEAKKRTSPVLKRPDQLAALCSVIEFKDEELLRQVCAICKLNHNHVVKFMTRRTGTAFCPSTSCHGATFVPQGRSALVVPFQIRECTNAEPTCHWCGEKLDAHCPACGAAAAGGPVCTACGLPLVECPFDLGNRDPPELRKLCMARNEENERLRFLIRSSHDGPPR